MTRADGLLLLLLGVGIGMLFRIYWTANLPAQEVAISSPAGTSHYPLHTPRRIQVNGPIGVTTLEIDNDAVRFVASPCRQQICVRSGWHRRGGAVAACVPNRISVLLHGEDPDYDGFSY